MDEQWSAPSGRRPGRSSARRRPPPDGMSTLDRLLAYEEIRQLVNRYALAVNMRDLDALVELFVDDVSVGDGRHGRQALADLFRLRSGDAEVDVLEVTTQVTDLIDADHAAGTVYSRCEMGSPGRWARQSIAYEDVYERRGGTWYFVSRAHLLFYGLEVPERPLDQPPARWPHSPVGRGTVPYDWPSWQASRRG
jgi:ketosteroid isomerase-like protein